MPHGVLFRGGAEKEIRKKFLEQDIIEAVIGLPQNLFYGAGIPACILIMRPNLTGHAPNEKKPAARQGKVLFINADAEFHAGRAQNYLRPEHVEKVVSTFDRYQDIPGYARVVPLSEIANEANDFNLNIRRYVDNSPPPEPHDVRAHLLGGVPVAEVKDKRPLFDALGFDPARAFAQRKKDAAYCDFAPMLPDRSTIRPLVESDPSVQACLVKVRQQLTSWWQEHSPRLAGLPKRRDLNRVRAEFLDTFVASLLPLNALNRFKLAGVIATWWTDTLPDFKTLLENGFPGVIDGWVDAIADAVEDDESAGPVLDPFAHKLVRRTMTDYLQRIAAAKADIFRLKGEKEAFEQSNASDDLDEEELDAWNYAKDLDRQMRELKASNKDALKELAKVEKQGATGVPPAAEVGILLSGKRARRNQMVHDITTPNPPGGTPASTAGRIPVAVRTKLQPVIDRLAALEAALVSYEQTKKHLAEARARFRTLTDEFVNELKSRCEAMNADQKRALVLDLFAQDVQEGLDAAMAGRRQELVGYLESLWIKYAVPLGALSQRREEVSSKLADAFKKLSYVR
jgi:type I restriction enzyme M protein